MVGGVFTRIVIEALLGFDGVSHYATACVGAETVQETQSSKDLCGWAGVAVRPMTAAFADSLGMAEPYGAIFDQPEPGSPAATAGIEQGDVLTAINGSPLMRASDFARIISMTAPGTSVYLNTSRNGETMQVTLILASTPCRSSG